jgi:hypothetical protein
MGFQSPAVGEPLPVEPPTELSLMDVKVVLVAMSEAALPLMSMQALRSNFATEPDSMVVVELAGIVNGQPVTMYGRVGLLILSVGSRVALVVPWRQKPLRRLPEDVLPIGSIVPAGSMKRTAQPVVLLVKLLVERAVSVPQRL